MVVSYTARKTLVSLAGYFVGAQDDSTLLSDPFFGYSMPLPNQDMDPAYQKFDVHGSTRFHPRLRAYVRPRERIRREVRGGGGVPGPCRAPCAAG